jgi:chorismate mutase
MQKKLDEQRGKIFKIDEQIIQLLSQRQSVASEIGRLKHHLQQPFLQPDIWADMCHFRQQLGVAKGISPDMITDIYEIIHKYSIIAQSQNNL